MFVDRRIKGMPITFVIVVVLMIVLTIFFGAWAVSAGAQTQDESFALAVTGAPNLDRTNSGPSSGSSGSASSNLEGEGEASDEWWGKALLTACPFH